MPLVFYGFRSDKCSLENSVRRAQRFILALEHARFKIGICRDPVERWFGEDHYGLSYKNRYTRMLIFYCAEYASGPDGSGEWEKRLIGMCRHLPACQNARPGGEGAGPHSPHFGYVVIRTHPPDCVGFDPRVLGLWICSLRTSQSHAPIYMLHPSLSHPASPTHPTLVPPSQSLRRPGP